MEDYSNVSKYDLEVEAIDEQGKLEWEIFQFAKVEITEEEQQIIEKFRKIEDEKMKKYFIDILNILTKNER